MTALIVLLSFGFIGLLAYLVLAKIGRDVKAVGKGAVSMAGNPDMHRPLGFWEVVSLLSLTALGIYGLYKLGLF